MARPLRIECPDAFYHVLNRGLERREIFRERKDYEAFLDLCLAIHRRFRVIFHAYSLMPNHYHLMLETPEANLSRAMRHLDGVYTQAFNRRTKRVGPLFQGRYKATLIEEEAYSLELSRYIHLNPVKARIVRRPEDHPYSSFRYYLGQGRKPEFLETDWLLGQFHKRTGQARRAFHQFTLEGLKDPWTPEERLRAGAVLGSETFFERIRQKYLDGREDREIPELRKSRKTPGPEQIRACLEECGIEERAKKRLLIWALRRYTPLKLKEIAERADGRIGYSAVSQTCRRVEEERGRNRRLAAAIRHIEAAMSNVKT